MNSKTGILIVVIVAGVYLFVVSAVLIYSATQDEPQQATAEHIPLSDEMINWIGHVNDIGLNGLCDAYKRDDPPMYEYIFDSSDTRMLAPDEDEFHWFMQTHC